MNEFSWPGHSLLSNTQEEKAKRSSVHSFDLRCVALTLMCRIHGLRTKLRKRSNTWKQILGKKWINWTLQRKVFMPFCGKKGFETTSCSEDRDLADCLKSVRKKVLLSYTSQEGLECAGSSGHLNVVKVAVCFHGMGFRKVCMCVLPGSP